jgi:hypothetical protein
MDDLRILLEVMQDHQTNRDLHPVRIFFDPRRATVIALWDASAAPLLVVARRLQA